MKALVCEMCGSHDIIKKEGMYECQSCGTKYSVEEAKKLMVEGEVEVHGTVKIDSSEKLDGLYVLARRAKTSGDSKDAQKYYEQISVEDPYSWEAQYYKLYFGCIDARYDEFVDATKRFANSINSVFELIKNNVADEAERKNVYLEIYNSLLNFNNNIASYVQNNGIHLYGVDNLILHQKHDAPRGKLYLIAGDAFVSVGMKDEGSSLYQLTRSFLSHVEEPERSTLKKRMESFGVVFNNSKSGCYVATAVYGSYDCPEVWVLRRFRDDTLAKTWYGRTFVRVYYAISPTLVKWFGNTAWFKKMWRRKLDSMIQKLKAEGVKDTPYNDRNW